MAVTQEIADRLEALDLEHERHAEALSHCRGRIWEEYEDYELHFEYENNKHRRICRWLTEPLADKLKEFTSQ